MSWKEHTIENFRSLTGMYHEYAWSAINTTHLVAQCSSEGPIPVIHIHNAPTRHRKIFPLSNQLYRKYNHSQHQLLILAVHAPEVSAPRAPRRVLVRLVVRSAAALPDDTVNRIWAADRVRVDLAAGRFCAREFGGSGHFDVGDLVQTC